MRSLTSRYSRSNLQSLHLSLRITSGRLSARLDSELNKNVTLLKNFIFYVTVLPLLLLFSLCSSVCFLLGTQTVLHTLLRTLWSWNDGHNQNHYGTLQEFPLVSHILDDRYYAQSWYISLCKSSDRGPYNNFDLTSSLNSPKYVAEFLFIVCVTETSFAPSFLSFLESDFALL